MGYGDNECLICYMIGNRNVWASGSTTLCLTCLHELSKNGRATGRVTTALNQHHGLKIGSRCRLDGCSCYCICYDKDYCDESRILDRATYPEDDDVNLHDGYCPLIMCMKGESDCHCHYNCDKCSYCNRCQMGAIVVEGTACGTHGGADYIAPVQPHRRYR